MTGSLTPPPMARRTAGILLGVVALLVIGIDQQVKVWVTTNLQLYEKRPLIPEFLELFYVHNEGAAFGMLKNAHWLFLTLAVVGTGAAVYSVVTRRLLHPMANWALAMVVGGAWGNGIDRLVNPGGYVIDMFHFVFVDFAIFNVADIFLTVGGVLICYYLLFIHEKRRKLLDPPPAADGDDAASGETETTETDDKSTQTPPTTDKEDTLTPGDNPADSGEKADPTSPPEQQGDTPC